jgi:energy-converting hydrogenase Eha subunit C
MLIGIISFVLSSIASYAITQFLHYKVLVSETYLDIGVQANLFYLISALPLVLMISYFSSFLFTKRVKSLGLDSLLREY